MAKKTINSSGTATQMIGDMNDNFTELYSLPVVHVKRVKVYDVMTRCGDGASPIYVEADITAGTKYVIEKSNRGNNWQYIHIETTDSSKTTVQTLLSTTSNVGDYDTEIAASGDAKYFSIRSYANLGYINIFHYEDVPTLGATRWLGKKWLLFGDSVSTEHAEYAEYGYGELVAKSLGMLRENVAVSGKTTLDYINGFTSSRTYKWDSFSTKYDLVTVMLGANDQGYNCPLGAIADTGTSTFFGRIKTLYENLRSRYPKSVIVLITPIKRYNSNGNLYTNTYGLSTEPFAEAIKDVANLYSTPYIDVFNTIDPSTSTARTNFFCSADGTHPTALGHELFIAPVIEAKLRDIAPFYFNDWDAE